MMSVIIRCYRVHGSPTATSRRIEQEVIPLISREPDFYAYYVVDPGNGTLVTISLVSGRIAPEGMGQGADFVTQTLTSEVSLEETNTGEVTLRVGL
jgi:hypothetical protein